MTTSITLGGCNLINTNREISEQCSLVPSIENVFVDVFVFVRYNSGSSPCFTKTHFDRESHIKRNKNGPETVVSGP